jgi:hypothetical protein
MLPSTTTLPRVSSTSVNHIVTLTNDALAQWLVTELNSVRRAIEQLENEVGTAPFATMHN